MQIGPDYGQQCVESLELATPVLSRDEDVVCPLNYIFFSYKAES